MPLVPREKLEKPRKRTQEHIRITVVQIRSRQEIRTDHLQTVAAGFIGSEHQSRCLQRLLDDRDLALVKFEIHDLPGLGFFPGQLLLHLSPELVFWHLASLVQPGCTIELLPIPPPRQLCQLQPFRRRRLGVRRRVRAGLPATGPAPMATFIFKTGYASEYHKEWDCVGVRGIFHMKRFSVICLGLGIAVLAGFAQNPRPATGHRTKARPMPSIKATGPRHALIAPDPKPGTKTGVDDQLNKLERDTAKSAGTKSKDQSNKTAHAGAPKSNDTRAARKALNFSHQTPPGVSKANQGSQPSSRNTSGLRRRVSPGAR